VGGFHVTHIVAVIGQPIISRSDCAR
jgi:hypothetical protein